MGTSNQDGSIEETVIETRELTFKALTIGDGDRYAILFHGFPDDAGSMVPLMEFLADHGFTAIAPYMRGYGETERPPLEPSNYTPTKIGSDVGAVLNGLNADNALVIGHDWGAVAVTTASISEPTGMSECITIAVPPDLLTVFDDHPVQVLRSWYWWLFQIPGVAEEAVRRHNFAFIERIWNLWSPEWDYSDERLTEVKQTLVTGQTVEAALQYYRGMFNEFLPMRQDELTIEGIEIPTLMITGEHDGCLGADLYDNSHECYDGRSELEVVEDAGHFVHIEKPKKVGERILDFSET